MKGAKNVEQADAGSWSSTRPKAARCRPRPSRANPATKGAVDLADAKARSLLQGSLPGRRTEEALVVACAAAGFVTKRNEYANKFQAA